MSGVDAEALLSDTRGKVRALPPNSALLATWIQPYQS